MNRISDVMALVGICRSHRQVPRTIILQNENANVDVNEDTRKTRMNCTCSRSRRPNNKTKAEIGMENDAHAHPHLHHLFLKRDDASIVAIIARNHELPRIHGAGENT